MERGHAVDAMGTDKGKVRHAHAPVATFIDERDGRDGCIIQTVAAGFSQHAAVDRIDDLHVARQQAFKQRQRPAFQCFGQERVVGIAHRLARDLQRLAKFQPVLIDEQTHDFCDRDRRVRVVQLDRRMVGKRADVALILDVAPDDVLNGSGGEEIFLPQPQLLPGRAGVGGIEHAHQRIGTHLIGERPDMVARVEGVELQRVKRGGGPEPQRVDALPAPADDRSIDSGRYDMFSRYPLRTIIIADNLPAKADAIGAFAAFEFPGVAMRQPCFGKLNLPAILDALAEHAVHIADAIAISRDVEAREAFHEAGRKATQPAIAKRGIRLQFFQIGQIEPMVAQRLFHLARQSKVGQGIAQQAADEKF